jgi:HAD superfamily hydrolase (TIGR01509 family)
MIKAVIFDMGGVLAHDVWEHLLLDEPDGIASMYSLDRDLVKKVGNLLWEAFAYVPESPHNTWQVLERRYWNMFLKFFEHLRPDVSPDDLIRMTDRFIKPVENGAMIPLLERLWAEGMDLALCSNNNEFWFRYQMDTLNLHRFFSPNKTILSSRIGVSKSSPRFEMFHAAADALGVNRNQCVFVDDRSTNVERAHQCGMEGIHFTSVQEFDGALKGMGL